MREAKTASDPPLVGSQVVPKRGLEPPWPCGHTALNRACIPISPLRQIFLLDSLLMGLANIVYKATYFIVVHLRQILHFGSGLRLRWASFAAFDSTAGRPPSLAPLRGAGDGPADTILNL